MNRCSAHYHVDGTEKQCPRSPAADYDRCVFHLTPEERDVADVTASTLRAAFVEDVGAEDPARREYVDVHLPELDLSALVVDGNDVGHVMFRSVTVDGTLDLSGSVVKHPVTIEDCRIGRLDCTGASFEMDVTVDETAFGGRSESSTCVRARRAAFDRSLQIGGSTFDGDVEFAGCRVREWLHVDGVTIDGATHFPNASFGRAQFVNSSFEGGVEFTRATGDTVTFDRIRLTDHGADLALSEVRFDQLRVFPDGELACLLDNATVAAGRLDQPSDRAAYYDLTDATVGAVDLDCRPETFDRYRFYRTRFDGFEFASYREVFRENRWRLTEYAGDPETGVTIEGLEHTYLEAKQGASETGDSDTASMFFVRELRHRRRRYAAHANAAEHTLRHRVDAALRWLTNGFLDVVAGYGERPQRTLVLALAVIVSSALAYPATGGLSTGNETVRYSTHGVGAVLDGLYFSVVTFATLGLGDVHPISDVGRFIAASEGLTGAFLTAIFVFSLGRRVTR